MPQVLHNATYEGEDPMLAIQDNRMEELREGHESIAEMRSEVLVQVTQHFQSAKQRKYRGRIVL